MLVVAAAAVPIAAPKLSSNSIGAVFGISTKCRLRSLAGPQGDLLLAVMDARWTGFE